MYSYKDIQIHIANYNQMCKNNPFLGYLAEFQFTTQITLFLHMPVSNNIHVKFIELLDVSSTPEASYNHFPPKASLNYTAGGYVEIASLLLLK